MEYPLSYHNDISGGAAHYLVELVSRRKAKLDGILLEKGYWRDPVWQAYYRQQIQAAHSLLGVYEESVVVSTLKDMRSTWSLRPKFVKDEIVKRCALIQKQEEAERKLREIHKEEVVIETSEQTGQGRGSFRR